MSFTNPAIAGIDVSTASTTALFTPGTYAEQSGSVYCYLKAHAALTAGLVYSYTEASTSTDPAVTIAALSQTTDDTSPLSLCIPQIAVASGSYAWMLVGPGNGVVSVLANCAIDVLLYTTATAGSLDDASASAKVVVGIKLTTANGGSTANCACQLSQKLVVTA